MINVAADQVPGAVVVECVTSVHHSPVVKTHEVTLAEWKRYLEAWIVGIL